MGERELWAVELWGPGGFNGYICVHGKEHRAQKVVDDVRGQLMAGCEYRLERYVVPHDNSTPEGSDGP